MIEIKTMRPLTILIAALGGEGGGVLADWIVTAATAQDFPVQSTSIPGVSQRTGATTYYLEIFPVARKELGSRRPVMALTPSPGHVDVMAASELLEAGRAMTNGFVTSERTTLISSSHRIYTTSEKSHMGEGRFEDQRLLDCAREMAKNAILFDMQAIAASNGTVISAVLFGALAGSGVLPLSRAACEAAVRGSAKGVDASLRGFAAAYNQARGQVSIASQAETIATESDVVREIVQKQFPVGAWTTIEAGASRCQDYQDSAYANFYLDRLGAIADVDNHDDPLVTRETARFLALWMCYEDVIRVADLKTRKARFLRVRSEVKAKESEPVHIIEYLKPGVEEIASLLPPRFSKALLAWATRHKLIHRLNKGMHVRTSTFVGFALLRALAGFRMIRRHTARYQEEQALINAWLSAIVRALPGDAETALEIALCGRLIKGYGDTNRRGKENFLRILGLLEVELAAGKTHATLLRQAREAALADPEGRQLDGALQQSGIVPRPLKEHPVRFMKRPAPPASLVCPPLG